MKDTVCADLPHVCINQSSPLPVSWAALLRRGVRIALPAAIPVREFMIESLGMDEKYATESVPGLFLNNAPVDDWRTELVGGDDEVGMSGTMPGLCGIALRRSSPIRSFRPDLADRRETSKHGGLAAVKLFNFVALDCCTALLGKGVVVHGKDLAQYLQENAEEAQAWRYAWNNSPVPGENVQERLSNSDAVWLTVCEG